MKVYNLTVLSYESINCNESTLIDKDIQLCNTIQEAEEKLINLTLKYLNKQNPKDFAIAVSKAAKRYGTDTTSFKEYIMDYFGTRYKLRTRTLSHGPTYRFGEGLGGPYYSMTIFSQDGDDTVYCIRIFEAYKDEVITGYKAFNPDMTCYGGYQYAIDKEYTMDELPVICNRGFHFCKTIADCYRFYPSSKNSIICTVEASGDIVLGTDKLCTNHIKIGKPIEMHKVEIVDNDSIGFEIFPVYSDPIYG